ncbi:MAG: 50S ribosomal protein L3 N(5)-glutamine methyltransferase [Polynucleobacter sp.]|jgi:ribosomal protein L3 glutamine methyltransferase|nr:50S ribosomal protein L3 N(5)-glutamine methyltransferase [Polynucleobacter sp.]
MDPDPSQDLKACWQELTRRLEKAKLFFGHGAIDAQSEALWIISKQLDLAPAEALEKLNQAVTLNQMSSALAIANERIQTRQPLAYLLGEAWLMGIPFYCSKQNIVPRSFIAELIIDGTLDPWLPADGSAFDLCTGNGSLAILLAMHYPDLQIKAADLSMPALALAARNLDRHGLSEQIELLQGDLWSALPESNQENRFDLIICNPPYVNTESMQRLPEEYRAEPIEALAGGVDGMDLIRQIIGSAGDYLNERGALILEIGNEIDHFEKAFPHIPVIWMEVSSGNQQVLLIQAEDL